ncbi:MAG: hypothetical protein QXT00_02255 [Ignisphaera sp.]
MKRTLASVLAEVQNRTTHIINLIRARTGWRVYYIGSAELREPPHHTHISAYYIDCWDGAQHTFQGAEFPVFAIYFIVRSGAQHLYTSAMLCVCNMLEDIRNYVPAILTNNEPVLLQVTHFHFGNAAEWFADNCISIIKSYMQYLAPCYTEIDFARLFSDFAKFLSDWASSVLGRRVVFTYTMHQVLSVHKVPSPAVARARRRAEKLDVINPTPILPSNRIGIIARYTSEELRAVAFSTRINIVFEKEYGTQPAKYKYGSSILLAYHGVDSHWLKDFASDPARTPKELIAAVNRLVGACKDFLTQQNWVRDVLVAAQDAEAAVRARQHAYTLNDEAIVNAVLLTLSRVLRDSIVTCLPMLTGERVFCRDFPYIGHKVEDPANRCVYYMSNAFSIEVYPKAGHTELARIVAKTVLDVTIKEIGNDTLLTVYAEVSVDDAPITTYFYEQRVGHVTPYQMRQFLRGMSEKFAQDVCVPVIQRLSEIISARVYRPLTAGDVPVAARLA